MRAAFCGSRFCSILETQGGETAPQAVARLQPDVVLLEIGAGDPGFAIVARILEVHPRVRPIVVGGSDSGEHAMRALEAGVAGYLTSGSTPEELVEATRLVLEGETFVSPTVATRVIAAMRQAAARQAEAQRTGMNSREEQIAVHLLQGRTNREIAQRLGLREKTVKHYMTLLMQKFDVRNRLELALHLRQRGAAPKGPGPQPAENDVAGIQPRARYRADPSCAARDLGLPQVRVA